MILNLSIIVYFYFINNNDVPVKEMKVRKKEAIENYLGSH